MSEKAASTITTVSVGQAKPMVATAMKCGLTAMLHGSPAIGKSSIIHQLAADHDVKVIDLRLSQCDPTDLLGFPSIDPVTKKAGYAPMDTFPIAGDELPIKYDVDNKPIMIDDPDNPGQKIPARYRGWILFLDELTSAPPAVQAAAYKLILDRMVGQHKLHRNVAIVGAGNLEGDNAIVQPMSTALQSRLVHLNLTLNTKEWLEWALENGIDYRVTSYISFKPNALYTFDPNHTDKTYAAPRTWEFASRLLGLLGLKDAQLLPLTAGTISEGVAREFLIFCKIFDELPTIDSIINAPQAVKVPGEPSVLWALTGSIGAHATRDNAGALMEYVKRIPVEFQVVALRDMVRRNRPLMTVPSVRDWIQANANRLF
jgi:hypothetical protein